MSVRARWQQAVSETRGGYGPLGEFGRLALRSIQNEPADNVWNGQKSNSCYFSE